MSFISRRPGASVSGAFGCSLAPHEAPNRETGKAMAAIHGFFALCQIVEVEGRRLAIYRRSSDGTEWPDLPICIDEVVKIEDQMVWLKSSPEYALFPHPLLVVPTPGPPRARGRSLWESLLTCMSPESRQILLSLPCEISPQSVEWVLSTLSVFESRGEIVVTGKEVPIRADSKYTRIAMSEVGTWQLGVITDTAVARIPGTAVTYGSVRVFTSAEWRVIEGLGGPASDALKPGPKSEAFLMVTTLRSLLDEGQSFPTKKAAHQAVLRRLGGGTESKRGFSYNTFVSYTASLLTGVDD
jgi:hypothetical protein